MLKILDTPAEERFDRVTRLAQRAFAVPISLVSLVDGNRQWFKSRQGLDATETPREISFCGHAILKKEVLVVENAIEDERFHDNPLVTCDPNIRFYAGYPLSAPDGNRIGTLCVIDREPREFSNEDVELLEELGRMVEEELVEECLLTIDPVTGLSNLRGLEQTVAPLLALCERRGLPLATLLFRLDTGKDNTLDDNRAANFANLLRDCSRNSDIVARVSDNIFAAVLASTNLVMADQIRQRLENRVSEHNISAFDDNTIALDCARVPFQSDRHACINDLLGEAEWQFFELNQGMERA